MTIIVRAGESRSFSSLSFPLSLSCFSLFFSFVVVNGVRSLGWCQTHRFPLIESRSTGSSLQQSIISLPLASYPLPHHLIRPSTSSFNCIPRPGQVSLASLYPRLLSSLIIYCSHPLLVSPFSLSQFHSQPLIASVLTPFLIRAGRLTYLFCAYTRVVSHLSSLYFFFFCNSPAHASIRLCRLP